MENYSKKTFKSKDLKGFILKSGQLDSLYVKGFGATAVLKIHQAAMKNFA